MIPVWLYGSDGRALYCVYVATPMPLMVTFAGLAFLWRAEYAQYRQVLAHPQQAFVEVPAGRRPPEEQPPAQTPEPPAP